MKKPDKHKWNKIGAGRCRSGWFGLGGYNDVLHRWRQPNRQYQYDAGKVEGFFSSMDRSGCGTPAQVQRAGGAAFGFDFLGSVGRIYVSGGRRGEPSFSV